VSRETPLTFRIGDASLIGIVHEPDTPATIGVLIVVGGPQYRIGAHRQFVHLARGLAGEGIAAMRFDYRGLGDSEGRFQGFEHIEEDIDAALQAFRKTVPSLRSVVLWGLCDAAAAIAMMPGHAAPVAGVVLLNPWVRTDEGEARTYLRHYYLRRLLSADFWKKALSGRLSTRESAKGLRNNMAMARQPSSDPLPMRVTRGIATLPVPALLILSGNDLTAREFEGAAGALHTSPPDSQRKERLAAADHTISKASGKDVVVALTARFAKASRPAG
jgi:exosortase A-associated hydrolase 1